MLTIANTQKLKQKREFKQEEKTQIQIQNEIDEIAKWEAGQYVEGRYLISGQISAKCSSCPLSWKFAEI